MMNKYIPDMLAASVMVHVASAFVIYEQRKTIKKYKAGYDKMHLWAGVMNEVVDMHFQRGGTFNISDELSEKMAAYNIFAQNDML